MHTQAERKKSNQSELSSL